MRKLLLMMIILSSLSIVGCMDTAINEATEQGKLSLENNEYDKALSLFNLAIEKGSKDEEIKKLIEIINNFKNGKKLLGEGNFEDAKKILDSINREYSNYAIKSDIDALKIDIVKYKENNKYINDQIVSIKNLLNEGKYIDTRTESEKLLSGGKIISESQREKINTYIETANKEIEKLEEQKAMEERIAKEIQSKKENEWTPKKAIDMYEEVFKENIIWENYRSDLWSVMNEDTYDNIITLHFSNISGAGGSYAQFIRYEKTTKIISFDGNASFPDDPYEINTIRNSDYVILNTEELYND